MRPTLPSQAEDPRFVLTQRLLPLLLSGVDPRLVSLREQLSGASLLIKSETNWGFYAHFTLAEGARPVGPVSFCGGNAVIEVRGLRVPAGCILYVENGLLSFLEVYTHDEPWEDPPVFHAIAQVEPLVPGERSYAHGV